MVVTKKVMILIDIMTISHLKIVLYLLPEAPPLVCVVDTTDRKAVIIPEVVLHVLCWQGWVKLCSCMPAHF